MEILSEDWVAALDEAVASVDVDPAVDLTIDYRSGDFTYRVAVSDGGVRVTTDLSGAADVRISADPSVATAINRSERSALEGFMSGEVTVGGDVQKVMANQELLEGLGGIFSSVAGPPD